MAKQYRFKCRECIPRVRSMCIQEAQISPGAKRIIERAFESHTDTEATWDLLQVNCLLVQREELVIGEPGRPKSGLLSRMRNKQDQETAAPEPEAAKETAPVVHPPTPVARDGLRSRLSPREREAEPSAPVLPAAPTPEPRRRPDTGPGLGAVPSAVPGRGTGPVPGHGTGPDLAAPATGEQAAPGAARKPATLLDRLRVESETRPEPPVAGAEPAQAPPLVERTVEAQPLVEQPPEERTLAARPRPPLLRPRYPPVVPPAPTPYLPPGPRVLIVKSSGHRILLPEDGELILGRLDPLTRVKPDVDLTFEDRLDRGISRMHASVNGWQGRYELTDLGSNNGTWLNNQRLPLQRAPILQVGDEVRLGSCVLYFDQAPEVYSQTFPTSQFFLYCTFSGRFFPLPDKATILIGRADAALGYEPDIDLSHEGDAASVVSRRHAKLICNAGRFLVEDLGSANKTKIDGRPVYVGTQVPIGPGQHLWLGGCVLALDVMESSS